MRTLIKALAATLALTMLAGCPKAPSGAVKSTTNLPTVLVSKLAGLRASTLAVSNTAKGVAPTLSLKSSATARKILSLEDATDSIETESDTANADGSVDEKVTGPDGEVLDEVHADKPIDEVDADGNHNISENFDVKADSDGYPGKYAVKEKKGANGSVLSGEVDFTDSDQKTQKLTFSKDAETGKIKIHADEPDGANGDFDEGEDAQGNLESSGNLKLADGSSASLDVKLNKDGTSSMTAKTADTGLTVNLRADGSGTGEVLDSSGAKIGDLAFDKSKKGQLTMTDGTKADIQLK
ncbi:MAG TPA: hypothetical protein V6C82_07065 [Chroococcales cyanobacterium]|jgi:hypothetical protein